MLSKVLRFNSGGGRWVCVCGGGGGVCVRVENTFLTFDWLFHRAWRVRVSDATGLPPTTPPPPPPPPPPRK